MVDNSGVITGAVALLAGSLLSPIAGDLWRKIKGTQYATKEDCARRHKQVDKEWEEHRKQETEYRKDDESRCLSCRNTMQGAMLIIKNDGEKTHKLMILIAVRMGVSTEELREFL